jgi:hypothetical protein
VSSWVQLGCILERAVLDKPASDVAVPVCMLCHQVALCACLCVSWSLHVCFPCAAAVRDVQSLVVELVGHTELHRVYATG